MISGTFRNCFSSTGLCVTEWSFPAVVVEPVSSNNSGALARGNCWLRFADTLRSGWAPLLSMDTALRSACVGLFSSSLSLSSDCCLLNVLARGRPGTTLLAEVRDPAPSSPDTSDGGACDASAELSGASGPWFLPKKRLKIVDSLL